jgi:hypothetical protein
MWPAVTRATMVSRSSVGQKLGRKICPTVMLAAAHARRTDAWGAARDRMEGGGEKVLAQAHLQGLRALLVLLLADANL